MQPTHNLILFCKSYKNDLERVIQLSNSIKEYNKDNIPFYISVPPDDVDLFKENIPHYTEIINDKNITDNYNGWVGQQFVKALVYKLNLCKFYVCIDSDSYFFKDFYISDFLYSDDIPYMVMHQRESFYEFVDRFGEVLPDGIRKGHEKEYKSIMEHFGRKGKIYHYGTSPFIWDTNIWKWLDEKWGIDNLFKKHPNELKWYGEGALAYGSKFFPIIPLFKTINYKQQYDFYKQLGWEEKHFKNQYMGMIMQSNWGAPLKY